MEKTLQILLLITFISCGRKENSSNFKGDFEPLNYCYTYYKTANTNDYNVYTLPVIISQKLEDSLIYRIEYVRNWNEYVESKTDTIKFVFKEKRIGESAFYIGSNESEYFTFAQKRTYINGLKTHVVYKFYNAPPNMDCGKSYFWTPEFGVVLIRSIHWENFMKLKCHSLGSLSNEIDQLSDMIMADKTNFFTTKDDMNKRFK